jgi:LysR family glycine cleavage system transcriptional activator
MVSAVMRRDLPPFTSIRSFEAAARHLSFKAAADELHVTQSAISHQVKALEGYLGIRLFLRGPREITLTGEGARYLGEISVLLDQLAAATDHARDKDAAGPLHVTTTPAFAARWLVPRLTSFRAAYPEIELHIATSLAAPDFAAERLDIAIRFGQDRASGLQVVPFLSSARFPVASPCLLNGCRRIRTMDDLRRFTLLHDEVADGWQEWVRCAGFDDFDPSLGPRFAHCELVMRAATEAQGIALVYGVLAEDDLAVGRLIRLSDVELPARVIYSVVTPAAWVTRPKVAAFQAWLLQQVALRVKPAMAMAPRVAAV